jgi:hypothetical protein
MELSATVGLTIELDQRTNQLFGEIDGLRDQYQDQADVWLEIATQSERFDLARTDLSDLEWRVDDLDRRVAEAWGVAIADGGEDYGWQITDLVRQVAELQGRMNSGTDYGWQIDDLSWRVDDTQNQINALFDTETEMWDMMWRMWTALDSRQWTADYLHD